MQPLSWYYLGLVGVFIPYLCVKRALKDPSAHPSHRLNPLRTVLFTALVGGFALFTARVGGITLFSRSTSPGAIPVLLATAILVLGCAAIPLRWAVTSDVRRRRIAASRPRRVSDLPGWFLVSLAAGVFEEITHRGVLFILLQTITGDWWSAAALCALSFGAGHALQGWPGAVNAGIFGFLLQVLVRLTGSLYPAMVVHFVYDSVAPFIYLRLAQELVTEDNAARERPELPAHGEVSR